MASGGESCYHYRVKTLREIFKALVTLRQTPAISIRSAWASIKAGDNTASEFDLIDSIVDAVISIANDDDEKARKKAAHVAAPAATDATKG